MTIEEIIKEAFSQGWNASHECATDFDYEYALRNCLSDLDSEVKKLNIPAVMLSLPSQDEIDEQIDKYAFRVPYDGSNNFYDEVALKHYKAGIEWLLGRIRGNGA